MEQNLTIYENRQFVILNVNEIYLVDFSKIEETSEETLRKNIDNSKTFVKWDGEIPEFINSLSTKEGPYRYLEILNILSTPEWNNLENNIQ
jgi:hypothetical protein